MAQENPGWSYTRIQGALAPHMVVIDRAGIIVYAGGTGDKSTMDPKEVGQSRRFIREALADLAAGRKIGTPYSDPILAQHISRMAGGYGTRVGKSGGRGIEVCATRHIPSRRGRSARGYNAGGDARSVSSSARITDRRRIGIREPEVVRIADR
jgi:hypothetical protein